MAIQSRAVLDRDRNDICVSAAIDGVCAAEVDGTTTIVPAIATAAAVIRRVEPPRRTASGRTAAFADCFRNRSVLVQSAPFSKRPLSRASRPFTGSILKGSKGSIAAV